MAQKAMAAFDPSTDYFGSKYRKWDGVAPEADDEPGDEPQVEDVTDMLSVCDSTYSRRSARKKTRARRAAERAQEEEDAAFKKCVFCRELRVGDATCDAYCGTCPAQDRDNMSWAHAACLRKHNAPFQVKYGVGETLNTTGRWIQWSCPKCLRIAAELKKAAEERAASVRAVDAAHCVPRKLADGEDRGEVEASFDFSKWDAALKGEDMDDDERAEVERKEEEVAEEVRKRGAERSKKEITLAWKAKMKADRDAQEKKEKAALKGYTPKGPPVSLGTTARVDGLTGATRYNDRKAVVVNEKVADAARVAVQLLEGSCWSAERGLGEVLLVKRANLAPLPLEPRVPHAHLLEGRAVLLYADPKTRGELWVGDCLAAAVATRDGATKMDKRSVHNCPAALRDAHAWTACTHFLCCAKELCRGLRKADRCDVPLRDSLSENAPAKWDKGLAFGARALDAGRKLLVYCADGNSRAAATALAIAVGRGVPLGDAHAKLEAAGAAPNLAFVVDLVALEDQTAGTITLKVDVSEDDAAALLEKQPQKKDLLDLALGCQE